MMADRGAESGRVRESQTQSAVALYTTRSTPDTAKITAR